ncbi:FAD/NAD(P)-binding protein [Pimelobacter simplex]|uniref:FAD/NAD(P)-binding protein n=1 Tax=Nocardioides simplex TaxID=2045 RepID=A0A7J5E5A8_NOCSI|nr:FAD/NAD(P)-binding protein [Pimelobacter simplex]KAB2813237.1 FAD/NAD(P)-binding protein [Pimelobacter simplex]
MTERRIVVVGCGPRGLSLLQALARHITENAQDARWVIHVIDPGELGQGSHPDHQPDYLLTNTVAGQVTMFPDDTGPSFTEWSRLSGYRRFDDRFFRTNGSEGETVDDSDYLPRRLLGEYLTWVFDQVVATFPGNLVLRLHRGSVTDIEGVRDRMAVVIDGSYRIEADSVVLATGHCARKPNERDLEHRRFVSANAHMNSALRYFPSPYPVTSLRSIPPSSSVAIQGFGLTATDAITALTLGRGGRFENDGRSKVYLPSRREPRILLFSRSGRPFAARAMNQKGRNGAHSARYLTRQAVLEITSCRKDVDFDLEIIPLLRQEMAYAHDLAHGRTSQAEPTPEGLVCADELLEIHRSSRTSADLAAWQRAIVDGIEDDLVHAELGNLTSPVKAAADVIRDCRGALRLAVEGGTLHGDSHLRFRDHWVPLMNRISFGPPRARNHELLALIRAGVVAIGGGPGCTVTGDPHTGRWSLTSRIGNQTHVESADSLISAKLDAFEPENDSSRLTQAILRRGLGRSFSNDGRVIGGFDVTPGGRLVDADGRVEQRIWCLGYPTEGPRFYTHALPRAGHRSDFITDARVCIAEVIESRKEREDAHDEAS